MGSPVDTAPDHDAISRRWRLRLAIVIAVLALGALVASLTTLAVRESPLRPALLWLGVGALVLAHRNVPRAVSAEERPAMAATAAWIVCGIVLYFVVPVVLGLD